MHYTEQMTDSNATAQAKQVGAREVDGTCELSCLCWCNLKASATEAPNSQNVLGRGPSLPSKEASRMIPVFLLDRACWLFKGF